MDPAPPGRPSEPAIEAFEGDLNRDLSHWRWLWQGDRQFPIRSHRRWIGGLIVAAKKVLRLLVKTPQTDLWERQRQYNLVIQDHLEATARLLDWQRQAEERLERLERRVGEGLDRLGADLQQVQGDLVRDLRAAREAQERELKELHDDHFGFLKSHAERLELLEGFKDEGLDDITRHADALFARVDQKLDRYRREMKELWGRLEALLAVAESGRAAPLVRAVEEQGYLELERLFRGTEDEIERRLRPYLGYLEERQPVLDLGCGRGEALELLRDKGVRGWGVDSSDEMVARCREKGLEAVSGDLFEALADLSAGSLGAVVSFHVIEHLPAESLDRLVRLAWRALRPGGVLIFETPNPLSVVVAARNFWLDPTHRRPVHPQSLKLSYRLAGFEPVVQLDLQPFAAESRLPEIEADGLPDDARVLVERINHLRDRLDELLFGFQDYGMVGFKPAPEESASAPLPPAGSPRA